jgi:hypothetical protein
MSINIIFVLIYHCHKLLEEVVIFVTDISAHNTDTV